MILVKILPVCYLFTCCTHLSLLIGSAQAEPAPEPDDHDDELRRHDKLHELMSEQDLRRTFQVDSHDQVPEYEVLKLTVDDDGSHLISPISDLGALTPPVNPPREPKLESQSNARTSARHKRETPPTSGRPTGQPVDDDKLIVMRLSTFGRDFKLRLKRNADFQQRIKDMKMFMAESTSDGQLRYTEIKAALNAEPHPTSQQDAHGKPQQEPPHKRSASTALDEQLDEASLVADTERLASAKPGQVWNIGSTYHDEHNLAALLIDHDKRTGQLQVEGTIGNDFVIKPMPQGTLDALAAKQLLLKRQRKLSQPAESTASPAAAGGRLTEPEQQQVGAKLRSSADHNGAANVKSADLEQSAELKAATHLHDDDPHDDDEMFLDEDEALELAAQLQRAPPDAASNHTPSALSKAQAERKWRKYRKLVAQTQVPKQVAASSGGRARRQAASHHIVFRQRPSGDHMHELASSFSGRLAPQDNRMDADWHDPLGGQFELEPALLGAAWHLGAAQRPLAPPYALNDTAATNRTSHRLFKRAAQVRRKRQAPDTVWPEVLLVVDYDSFLLHGGDSRDVKRYFVSFWNGVDLRYKLLVHPHIRISLAGMIVAKDRDATPYLERNRLRAPNADAVDAAGALTDMGKYLYREDRLPTYDLAVVITKLDMCRRRYEGGRCNRGTAGFAYVGGACVVNKRLEKVNSVAIIEDSGGFSGIIVAAHEVGHLLGCVHDGSPPPSYLGGPGATHCPWEDGFIMSDLRHTERGFRWSQCSVEQFKHFLNGETATCLYNYPHESQMLHRLLPGTMLSLDEQCKRDRGTNACFKDARVCAQLFCFDNASGYCVSYRPAAEGSPCGEGQVCRNGKCVGEIENIIPDYTHQSQTIVARRPALGSSLAHSRIADNGLSASSTSTATSSPDARLPSSASATSAQLSSRMDTFALEPQLSDVSPLAPHRTSSAPGYSSSSSGALSFKHQHNTNHASAHLPSVPKSSSSKSHPDQYGKEQPNNMYQKYQLRSGYQAAAMAKPGANSQVLGQQPPQQKGQPRGVYNLGSKTATSLDHNNKVTSGSNLFSSSHADSTTAASSVAARSGTNSHYRQMLQDPINRGFRSHSGQVAAA